MRLRFGDHVFDSDTREVLRAGRSVAISPKAFELLELLLECRPRAVSKAEIHSRLWPDTHVSEANLGNLVVELRSALRDDARQPRVIRTVARFGYAFIASGLARAGSRRAPETSALVYRLVWGRREIALDPGDNLIGRDREAVVWIDDESVSRRHARVSVRRKAPRSKISAARTERTSAARRSGARAADGSRHRQDRTGDADAARAESHGVHAVHHEGAFFEVTLPAGTRLSAYEIVRPIGAGGMGEVYRARDTKLSRDVAIKVLPAEMARDAERLSRFEKEARTASALSHPNIVTIYEIGQVEGTWFIAMEIVEGRTLRELLGAGPVSGEEAPIARRADRRRGWRRPMPPGSSTAT